MSAPRLVIFYAMFAAISIAANIGLQKLSLITYSGAFSVPLSVVVGTGGGLVVKFLLDKLWIFRYQHRDLSHGIQSFLLYTVMGLATTAIFWGFEFGADAIYHSEPARFTGGVIGLVIGYIVKYRLDKKFVFA
ncbi:putative flippase GtrA [Paraburkholderia sp. JPY158]|uniref:Putative flippase GtrA n=1 Tax=Paraburkholderia atlantica TaxID=2654982 RepID=A0A7W8QA01_PARAM|nr:GtrA family protein [Paraburkholderia atlantica]MBB5426485.1 putative flippase GtrA [Paraburkholderia atlantica]